jgi:acyl-CoA hydrolase
MIVGQVTDEMPFMYGEAPVATSAFDAVLDDDAYNLPLFGAPGGPVSIVDHAIGLRVSTLVRDGGTLQIGIGSLGNAIGWALQLRHTRPETYREVVESLGAPDDAPELVAADGGLDPFEEGLYGATEMFTEAFLHLYECGVLSRTVYDDPDVRRLADGDAVDGDLDAEVLAALLESGAISTPLEETDVRYLKRWGVFRDAVRWADGRPRVDGEPLPTDVSDPAVRETLASRAVGNSLDGGDVLHGAFFMGSQGFYEGLRALDEDARRTLRMRSVQFTNERYGDEALKRRQRRDARFVNTP